MNPYLTQETCADEKLKSRVSEHEDHISNTWRRYPSICKRIWDTHHWHLKSTSDQCVQMMTVCFRPWKQPFILDRIIYLEVKEIQSFFNITQKFILEYSEEIWNLHTIESGSSSWTRSTSIHDQVIQWTKVKVRVYSNFVLCLGKKMWNQCDAIAKLRKLSVWVQNIWCFSRISDNLLRNSSIRGEYLVKIHVDFVVSVVVQASFPIILLMIDTIAVLTDGPHANWAQWCAF